MGANGALFIAVCQKVHQIIKKVHQIVSWALVSKYCNKDIRKYFLTQHIIDVWNFLPDNVVNAPTVTTFKNLLHSISFDRFLKGGGLDIGSDTAYLPMPPHLHLSCMCMYITCTKHSFLLCTCTYCVPVIVVIIT